MKRTNEARGVVTKLDPKTEEEWEELWVHHPHTSTPAGLNKEASNLPKKKTYEI